MSIDVGNRKTEANLFEMSSKSSSDTGKTQDTPIALNRALSTTMGLSMRERVVQDDGYRRAIYEAAQSAEQRGHTETARRLRSYLDVKLVEKP